MSTRFIFALLSATIFMIGCLAIEQAAFVPLEESMATSERVRSLVTIKPPPRPYTERTPAVAPLSQVLSVRFAPYRPYPVEIQAAVPLYAMDLGQVTNPEALTELTESQQAALEANGFVVVPRPVWQIYSIYQGAKDRGMPAFVTTDAMLHTFHILYDYALRLAEIQHFVHDLRGLSQTMLEASLAQHNAPTPVKEAAKRNAAYFAVAAALLDEGVTIPNEVEGLVRQELALIEAHSGPAESPIFGYKEDYSQYVPRGHYTRNETFQRYFKAMMWYGRMMFRLRPGEDPESVATGHRETRQAILMVDALRNARVGDEPAWDVWERIYEPTVFFVGRTDDLNVHDYSQIIAEVYGEKLILTDLEDDARLEAFIEKAMILRPPRIISSYVTDREKAEEVTKGFRFMGQRFIPDSYVFQQLVYDKVKLYQGSGRPFTLVQSQVGPIRGFPRGLDVASVLDSARAAEIIEIEGDAEYEGYEEQVAKLREEFRGLPPEQWTENLYWSWLHSLRPLLEVKGEGYPVFMQNPAWVDRDLHAFLGSWAELRHDTILYAKQSQTVRVTGIMPTPEPVKGYVEPQPEVYARLASLAGQMRAGLGDRHLLNREYEGKLERMESLLLALKDIAERELTAQPLTDEDYELIRNIGGIMEGLTTFSPLIKEEVESKADQRMAIVADVHTDVNSGQVLEEGVGDAFPIYVVAPIEGRPTVAKGGVFSYYEFLQPMSDRLTDEAWQALEPKPARPLWTESFIVE